jgi:hypothetical protein
VSFLLVIRLIRFSLHRHGLGINRQSNGKIQQLRDQAAKQRQDTAAADRVNFATADSLTAPEEILRRTVAKGQGSIANAKAAQEAGFAINGNGVIGSRRYGATSASPTKSAQEFKRGLMEGGLTNPFGLSAALGQAQVESNFVMSAVGDNGTAQGGFQWREERQQRLRQFAQEHGTTIDDPYINGLFAATEMQNEEKGPGSRVFGAKSLEEANEGMISYLRPKGAEGGMKTAMHGSRRAALAGNWYDKMYGKGASAEATTTVAGADEEGAPKFYNPSQVDKLKAAYPDLERRLVPVPELVNSKGYIAYKLLPPDQPVVKGAKVAAVPGTTAEKEDDDEDEFDPTTGD